MVFLGWISIEFDVDVMLHCVSLFLFQCLIFTMAYRCSGIYKL